MERVGRSLPYSEVSSARRARFLGRLDPEAEFEARLPRARDGLTG